ncbi:hypothetical protein NPIL_167301 [Nephila pilipes]|uniref:Uncharacterized protein n=1 Tax=Nephila pilipes TaxID=299642 RepID=A0A8X6MRE8_NEPPI|nr:hypothetical protein NPIL_167301 [Nephila pilipes]
MEIKTLNYLLRFVDSWWEMQFSPPKCVYSYYQIQPQQASVTDYCTIELFSLKRKFVFISACMSEEMDFSHIAEKGFYNTVSALIMNYCLNETPRSTEIKLNVMLTNEIAVSQRSRRNFFCRTNIR